MTSLQAREGWLMIDHRASPGTAEVPEGALFEAATFTCPHCNFVVVKHPNRVRPRNVCHKCMRATCDAGGCVTECHPIERMVDLALKYPDSGQPFLLRGPDGRTLHDTRLEERERIY